MNVSFDDTELSTLGYSVIGIDGRGMAEWRVNAVEIPSRQALADLSSKFEPGSTSLDGFLSADTDAFSMYTHSQFLLRLDAMKAVLNPLKGFRKLVVTGDQPNRFRWARYTSMGMTEHKPVFELPFQPVAILFQNHEPFWREPAALVRAATAPKDVPNLGSAETCPIIELSIGATVVAYSGSKVQPVNLLTIDDFQLNWKGTTSAGALNSGDVLVVDSETLTVTLRPFGSDSATDVIRYYDYAGPGAYASSGFPVIKQGGSTISYIHPRVNSVSVRYDRLYL